MADVGVNSGPIPGANYTSDTKNYPWRQPPEFSDLNDALDYLAKKLTQFKVANGVLTMAELGLPLYKIADMILTMGVGEGKWTVDYTLLMAGPVTRMLELICIGFGVEYELGIYDDEDNFTTGQFFEEDRKLKSGGFELLEEHMPEIKEAADESQGPNTTGPEAGGEGDLQMQGFMAMQSAPAKGAPAGEEGK